VKYAEKNDFSGTPTLPKEAKFTVDFAKKLHKIGGVKLTVFFS